MSKIPLLWYGCYLWTFCLWHILPFTSRTRNINPNQFLEVWCGIMICCEEEKISFIVTAVASYYLCACVWCVNADICVVVCVFEWPPLCTWWFRNPSVWLWCTSVNNTAQLCLHKSITVSHKALTIWISSCWHQSVSSSKKMRKSWTHNKRDEEKGKAAP